MRPTARTSSSPPLTRLCRRRRPRRSGRRRCRRTGTRRGTRPAEQSTTTTTSPAPPLGTGPARRRLARLRERRRAGRQAHAPAAGGPARRGPGRQRRGRPPPTLRSGPARGWGEGGRRQHRGHGQPSRRASTPLAAASEERAGGKLFFCSVQGWPSSPLLQGCKSVLLGEGGAGAGAGRGSDPARGCTVGAQSAVGL